MVFCAWAYTLGRAFLSGTAGGGGGAGAGAGEVCPTRWLGLGALWLLLLRTLIHRIFFWATRFFLVGLIGFHGSVRLEMILLHVASFPLNDTPKPVGAVFYSLAH